MIRYLKEKMKFLFWKLPISSSLKEEMRIRRYQSILKKEEKTDKENKVQLSKDTQNIENYAKSILQQVGLKSEEYRPFKTYQKYQGQTVLAAYYLTQYHPTKENDAWWGKGTTEWNNVNQAVPQFVGHYQPRKPGELGYYDLRIKDNMARQIELAKNYGIGAFCFYYYWFDGRRLLDLPLNTFLQNKDLDIPFFYCWANENWTKRFTGTDSGVLIGISQNEENYTKFIMSVLDDMKDERYYTIGNKPVLSIYRPALMPNPETVLISLRKRLEKIYILLQFRSVIPVLIGSQ